MHYSLPSHCMLSSLSLPPSLSLSLSRSLPLSLSISLSYTPFSPPSSLTHLLTYTHSHTHSLTHSLTYTHSFPPSLSLLAPSLATVVWEFSCGCMRQHENQTCPLFFQNYPTSFLCGIPLPPLYPSKPTLPPPPPKPPSTSPSSLSLSLSGCQLEYLSPYPSPSL